MKTINKRKSFLNILEGTATETERRSFDSSAVGGVLVPKEVYTEFIGKDESENLLRKHGTLITGDHELELPILTNDIEVVAHSEEYASGETVKVNQLGLTAELLAPIEFDTEVPFKKRLLRQNPRNKEMVLTLLKKAYVKAEKNYMYNGTDPKAQNNGSLFNRAKTVNIVETDPVKKVKGIRNAASSDVRTNGRWIINTNALEYVEDLILGNGEPVLKTVDDSAKESNGASYLLLGFPCDVTDEIKPTEETAALFYFGDLSSFYIYDDVENFEIRISMETYARTNEVAYNLHHLADGKLVYSEKEVTVFKAEIL